MAGLTPGTSDQVNMEIGTHLRAFVDVKNTIFNDQASLAGLQLQQPPYDMSAADETDIKTAINQLNTALQAVDMTFIDRLTGLF